MESTAGTGTGIGCISSSVHTYQKLSREFSNDIEEVTVFGSFTRSGRFTHVSSASK
jgi:hypothetical protein